MNNGNHPKKWLALLAGPTAVGKTDLTVQLALRYKTEVLSADSRQLYKEMSIGTAKPTMQEMNGVHHHFIDERSIQESFTAADYEREGLQRLDQLFRDHDLVLATGGTGLYMRALMHGFDQIPDVSPEIVAAIDADFADMGIAGLQQELQVKDPAYFDQVDRHNPHRLMRALAVIRQHGRPFSSFLNQSADERPFDCIPICLTRPRPILYERINQRVNDMMDAGLLDEAQRLYPFRHLRPLQTVGYSELFAYIEGDNDLDRAVELIQQNSRRYAKRQMTWFRNQGNWKMVDLEASKDPVQEISDIISDRMQS